MASTTTASTSAGIANSSPISTRIWSGVRLSHAIMSCSSVTSVRSMWSTVYAVTASASNVKKKTIHPQLVIRLRSGNSRKTIRVQIFNGWRRLPSRVQSARFPSKRIMVAIICIVTNADMTSAGSAYQIIITIVFVTHKHHTQNLWKIRNRSCNDTCIIMSFIWEIRGRRKWPRSRWIKLGNMLQNCMRWRSIRLVSLNFLKSASNKL